MLLYSFMYLTSGIRTSRDLDISVLNICDISVLGTGHLGNRYWTSRYLVLEISVLNNKNNLIEFKNFLKNIFTCRRCLYKFLCVFF